MCLSACLFFKQDHTLQLRLSWNYATLEVLKLPAILSARIKNMIFYTYFLVVHLFLYLDTGSYSFKASLHLQYWGCKQETSVGIPGVPHHNLKVYLVLWIELRFLWTDYFSGAVTKHLQKHQWDSGSNIRENMARQLMSQYTGHRQEDARNKIHSRTYPRAISSNQASPPSFNVLHWLRSCGDSSDSNS